MPTLVRPLGRCQGAGRDEDNDRMHSDPRHLGTRTPVLPLDERAMTEARQRQAQLTKPPGALGVLEEASVALCGIQRTCPPRPLARPAVAVSPRGPRRSPPP